VKKLSLLTGILVLSVVVLIFFVRSAHATPTMTVATTADTSGSQCTLRDAITAVQTTSTSGACPAGVSGENIIVPAGTYTLGSQLPTITGNIIIKGAGQQGSGATIITSSGSGWGAFHVINAGHLTLSGAEITGFTGNVPVDVYNTGELDFTDVVVANNTNTGSPGITGGIESGQDTTTINLNRVTISNNTALDNAGMEIASGTLNNVTIYGNTATQASTGGMIYANDVNTSLTMYNVTIANNTAATGGVAGFRTSGGSESLTFTNVLLSANTAGGSASNCGGAAFVSTGHNFSDDNTCTSSLTLSSDTNNTTLHAGSFGDNGGGTLTLPLLSTSPAIATGTTTSAPTVDERGVARSNGSHVSIGAFEYRAPNLTVASPSIYTFSIGTGGTLQYSLYNAGWSDQTSLGGSISSSPVAISPSSGIIDVFARGASNALWHIRFSGGAWGSWENLGGNLLSAPAAVSPSPGIIDVFAEGSTGSLVHTRFDHGWGAWEDLGGGITAAPTAVSVAPNVIDVFVHGGASSGMWHMRYDHGWGAWENLAGSIFPTNFNGGPIAVTVAPKVIDVFAQSSSNTLIHTRDDGGWGPSEDLGGSELSPPAVATLSSGIMDIFSHGTNNTLQHRRFAGTWQPWEDLGGTVNSGVGAAAY